MKRILAVLLSFALLLSLAACKSGGQSQTGGSSPEPAQTQQPEQSVTPPVEQEQNAPPVEQEPEQPEENTPEQEVIVLDGIGLTLILPESWKGSYGVEMGENNESCLVYVKSIRDRLGWGGHLFAIEKVWTDGPLTPEEFQEWRPYPAEYLFSTSDATYMISRASDVQYDNESEELYKMMESQIQDIIFQIENPDAVDG